MVEFDPTNDLGPVPAPTFGTGNEASPPQEEKREEKKPLPLSPSAYFLRRRSTGERMREAFDAQASTGGAL